MKILKKLFVTFLCFALLFGCVPVLGAAKQNKSFDSAETMKLNSSVEEYTSDLYGGSGYGVYAYYKITVPYKDSLAIHVSMKCTAKGDSYTLTNTLYTSSQNVIETNSTKVTSPLVNDVRTVTLGQELNPGTYYYFFKISGNYGAIPVYKIKFTNSFRCLHANTTERIIKNATCSSVGSKSTVCTDCSVTIFTGEIQKKPHTLPSEWETVREATCAKEGERIKKCTVCGQIAETEAIPSPEHTFGEWETTRETTCAESGEKKRVCSVCSFSETETVESLAHTLGDWKITKSPTCVSVGERERACSECRHVEKEEVEKLEHKFGKWETTEKSTCTKKGKRIRICSGCSLEESEELPLDAHTYGAWNITVKSTCYNKGKRERFCTVCSEKEQEELPLEEHIYDDWKEITEATCRSAGKKQRICMHCLNVQIEEIPMTPHDFGSWRTKSKATETSTGSEYRTCSECGKEETNTIPRLVHGELFDWKVTKTPTCTESGTRTKYCSYCGKGITTETVPKTAHNFGVWTTVSAAKYKTDGKESRKCTVCGYTETRTVQYTLPGKAAFKANRTYSPFSDVGEQDWYYRYVKTAYEYKLANGVGNSAFSPDNKFTVAQVLTVAANIHTAYCGTTVGAAQSNEPWYMPYVRYCLEQKIITADQFSDYTKNITRGEMAIVFASLLPDEEYKGTVTGSNPDVKGDMKCYGAVSKLFRAGIVSGDAGSGNFRPNDEIKRSEACVIFTRIAAPEYRISGK